MGELLVLGLLLAIAFLNLSKRVKSAESDGGMSRRQRCQSVNHSLSLNPMRAIEVTNGLMSDYPGVYKRPGYYAENLRNFERRADAMSLACMPLQEGFHAATGGVVKGYVPGLKRATDVIGSRRMTGGH